MEETELAKTIFQDRLAADMLAEFFGMFSSRTRILIISILVDQWKPGTEGYWRGVSVQEISEKVDASASVVSHNLRFLRQARVVHTHRVGKQVYYFITDDCISQMFFLGLNHISEPMNQEKSRDNLAINSESIAAK